MDQLLEDRIRAELVDGAERTVVDPAAVPVPPIPVERYRDARFFELENERVWARSWLFAGHESEISEPGAYKLFTRSGAPILVVRGHDGEVRAFYNSCRHRGAPVVRDDCGVAKRLTCQYHSWSYDTAGELKAVPDARSFPELDQSQLGLTPVRCEIWEGFIWVCEDPNAGSLRDYLGPLCEQMQEIDGTNLQVLGRQNHRIECNWKLLVDAFVEVYHIRTVHPDNAALLYDDRSATVAMLPNGHSRLTVAKRPELIPFVAPSAEADNPSVGDLWRETSTSFGIFPNIVAPMDTGAFAWICMWPDGQRATDLELVWFAPAWGDGEPLEEHGMRMALFETVMAQDTANMNAIQRSVDSRGARPFQIGWHERLIHHFHRSLDLVLGDVPAACAVSDALDHLVEPS
ncbi:MAG: aromatic ring-hydroxylating dioxygenase subunit alpha [Acidimicrobiales bacterium]